MREAVDAVLTFFYFLNFPTFFFFFFSICSRLLEAEASFALDPVLFRKKAGDEANGEN